MAQRVPLFVRDYLEGFLNEDLPPLADMVMRNYDEGRFMAKDEDDIRSEDVRINFTPQVQRIVRALEREWFKAYGEEIELCWNVDSKEDPATAYWAVVHDQNESTNLHTHETSENYQSGAQVSAAYYVQAAENSGDLVFQYHSNPYILNQTLVKAQPNKFVMFDSTLPHFVTKNRSDEKRIVISMNFRFKG